MKDKSTPLPNLIPSSAIYRLYAIRTAIIAGQPVDVIAEQIGGDYSTHASAAKAAKAAATTGLRCKIIHVGGSQ